MSATNAPELNRQLDRRAAEVSALQRLWKSVFLNVPCPDEKQFGWWLSSHPFELEAVAQPNFGLMESIT
jgi:hypothetical protein